MKQTFQLWAERIDARSLRERLLIFAAAALALVMLVVSLVLDPLTARRKTLLSNLEAQQTRMDAARLQVQTLVANQARDPDAELKARLSALKQRSAELDARLSGLERSLVRADRMGEVLRDLLARNPGVRLVALSSLPPAALAADGKPADDKRPAVLYRHGVEISVEGTYADLYAYVKAIESSPWRFVWSGVSLTVVEWPVSRLTLTLHTLSLDRSWLSV